MIREWEAVIGLEVHLQLKTGTKIWCGCDSDYDNAPLNTHTCPICLGHPGALPKLNERVADYAIKAALSLNCDINPYSTFVRKNYFYPDLSKGYQITQLEKPYASRGFLELKNGKKVRLDRIQIEEDTAKSIHAGSESFMNYNRASMPLLELVSEPDISSSEEAYEYLTNLKDVLQYIGISDVSMENGSLRCDANISVKLKGEEKLGTRVEVKNLNSFKAVARAIDYEIGRQIEALEKNETIYQETRLWNEEEQTTKLMRSKEDAMDYRFFPEPDLGVLVLSEEMIKNASAQLPETKLEKIERFKRDLNLSDYDAAILASSIPLANYFEECVATSQDAKLAANWIITEILRILKEDDISIEGFAVSPAILGELLTLIKDGTISGKIAKNVFEIILGELKENGSTRGATVIVKEEGLAQVSDTGEIQNIVQEVLENNEKLVGDYHEADEGRRPRVLKGLIGQVMKATKGKANPQLVTEIITDLLNK